MKTQKTNAVDTLVTRVTSFRNLEDMVASMKTGYIPTLNGGKAYSKLAGIVRRMGYRVYRNGLVA